MGILRGLPFPIRLLLFAAAGFFCFKFLKSQPALVVTLAVLLWTITVTGVFYAAGYLNPLSRVPLIALALGRLTGQSASALSPPSQAPSASGARGTPTSASPASSTAAPAPMREPSRGEREKLMADALAALKSLRGLDGVMETIDNRLIAVAWEAQKRGESGLGTKAPAVLVVLCGPRGTGKTTIAGHLSRLLCGLNVVKTQKIVALQDDSVGGYGASARASSREMAEAALDGTLFLDNADWLARTDPMWDKLPGAEVGDGILDVASVHPGRLVVLATMSQSAAQRLQEEPRLAGWVNKLRVITVELPELNDEVLLELLKEQLNAHQLSLDPVVEPACRNWIKDLRREKGQEFDNAEAMRRLADDIHQRVIERVRCIGEASQASRRVVTPDDMRSLAT